MARFLIEVPHKAEPIDCARAIEVFLKSGSHFMTNADWGCMDGAHKAWIIVDVGSKDEARQVLPPAFRAVATIVQLNSFTMEQAQDILRRHG